MKSPCPDLRAQPGVSREGHQGTMMGRHHWEESYSHVSCWPQQAPGDQESVATSGAFQEKLGSCEGKERVQPKTLARPKPIITGNGWLPSLYLPHHPPPQWLVGREREIELEFGL